MAERANDPHTVLLRSNKLPMSLIRDAQGVNGVKQHKAKMMVEASPFSGVFGPKSQRKRVKLDVSNLEDLAGDTAKSLDTYQDRLEQANLLSGNAGVAQDDGTGRPIEQDATLTAAIEPIFNKGQSKRIWNELYKVIDSSDVVLHVLDARDPLGTRCRSVEKYLRAEAPHKHLVFVLNKCDLVPTSVAVSFFFSLPSTRVASLRSSHPNVHVRGPSARSAFMEGPRYSIGRPNCYLAARRSRRADSVRSGFPIMRQAVFHLS